MFAADNSGKQFYPVGDEVHYQCAQGYKPLGTVVRQCQDDGRWSAKAPGWKMEQETIITSLYY